MNELKQRIKTLEDQMSIIIQVCTDLHNVCSGQHESVQNLTEIIRRILPK